MHATANLQSHTQAVIETRQKFVKALEDKQLFGEYVEMGALMKMLTLDTFGRAALGVDFGCLPELSEIAVSFEYLTSEMMRRMTWGMMDPTSYSYRIPTPNNLKHARHKRIVRGFIHDLVQERREHAAAAQKDNDTRDLLSELIKVHETSCSTTEEADEEALTDALVGLLFEG